MKTRLGAFALIAALSACSSQDSDLSSDRKAGEVPSAVARTSGIAGYAGDAARTLANAPDRGKLFTYQKAAVRTQGAYTLHPIQLSEEHAIRGAVTGMVTVPDPNGGEIKIRYERLDESADGNWSWIGRVVGGDAGQEAIFTFGEKAVFGSIPQAGGAALRLTTQNGIAYLAKADPSRLFKGKRAGSDTKVAPTQAAYGFGSESNDPLVAMAIAKARETATAGISTKAFTAANTIDLVAGYSNGLATSLGSDSAAVTRLNALVAVGNQALLNSNVNARIRLVGAVKVTYADNTDNGDALEQLTGNDGQNPVAIPAALAPLRAARDTTGADLVTLVRDFQPASNGCGIAWLLGSNGDNITAAVDAPYAYSVVSDGDYDQAGNTYYCEDITLVHELAHNMGSAHDIANAAGIPGRYPYSYGYKTAAAAGNFFTVMAYGDNNQTLYRVFSSPELTTCGGLACGVANAADNARSLRQTIPVVATFRATVVPHPQTLNNDYNGDGKSDLFWRNTSTGANLIWRSAESTTQTAANSVATAWKVVGTGDFNGDGKSDLFWRSPSAGTNVIWWSGAFAGSTAANSVPAGWDVVGTGDYNADGKFDVFWRNPSTGANVIWWSGNGAGSTTAAVVASQWKFAATGDFNGDGKYDVFWRNTASGANVIWWSGSGVGAVAINPVALPWQVAGSGDFNADGKGDIYWRHPTTGANIIWWSAAFAGNTVLTTVGTSWKLASIGDFDGDTKSDVVWRSTTTGQNVLYRGAISSTNKTLAPVSVQAWTVQP